MTRTRRRKCQGARIFRGTLRPRAQEPKSPTGRGPVFSPPKGDIDAMRRLCPQPSKSTPKGVKRCGPATISLLLVGSILSAKREKTDDRGQRSIPLPTENRTARPPRSEESLGDTCPSFHSDAPPPRFRIHSKCTPTSLSFTAGSFLSCCRHAWSSPFPKQCFHWSVRWLVLPAY